MAAMGFIHKHRPSPLLQAIDQGCRIGGVTLIGGVHQNRCSDAGMLIRECLQNAIEPGSISRLGLATVVQKWQIEQQRGELPQQAGLNQTAVNVSRHQYGLPRSAQSEQGCLQQPGGSIHPVPAMVDPHGIRSLPLADGNSTLRLKGTADGRQFRQVPNPCASTQQTTE